MQSIDFGHLREIYLNRYRNSIVVAKKHEIHITRSAICFYNDTIHDSAH